MLLAYIVKKIIHLVNGPCLNVAFPAAHPSLVFGGSSADVEARLAKEHTNGIPVSGL